MSSHVLVNYRSNQLLQVLAARALQIVSLSCAHIEPIMWENWLIWAFLSLYAGEIIAYFGPNFTKFDKLHRLPYILLYNISVLISLHYGNGAINTKLHYNSLLITNLTNYIMKKTNFIKTSIRTELKHKGVDFINEVGEVGLVYRTKHKQEPQQKRKITNSLCAADILRKSYKEGEIEYKEYFKVLLLNMANEVLTIVEISSGGLAGTVADPKIIFQAALLTNAASIILSHNHPSGNLKPSQADMNITKKIKQAGSVLELPVLDHVIIAASGHYSFADEGTL